MPATKKQMEDIADLISTILDERGMPQSQLADETGIQRSHLSQFLNKSKGLGDENLYKISSVLGIQFPSVTQEPCTLLSLAEVWRLFAALDSLGVGRRHLLALMDDPQSFRIAADLIIKFAD